MAERMRVPSPAARTTALSGLDRPEPPAEGGLAEAGVLPPSSIGALPSSVVQSRRDALLHPPRWIAYLGGLRLAAARSYGASGSAQAWPPSDCGLWPVSPPARPLSCRPSP